jgi:hypothetical protein
MHREIKRLVQNCELPVQAMQMFVLKAQRADIQLIIVVTIIVVLLHQVHMVVREQVIITDKVVPINVMMVLGYNKVVLMFLLLLVAMVQQIHQLVIIMVEGIIVLQRMIVLHNLYVQVNEVHDVIINVR